MSKKIPIHHFSLFLFFSLSRGRFDRELLFPLPNAQARATILDINTSTWNPPIGADTKDWIVKHSVGYCGADIKALCSEATLVALRRTYPQIYSCNDRLALDSSKIVVSKGDFAAALQKVVPSARRSVSSSARPLDPVTRPLLESCLDRIVHKIKDIFPASVDADANTGAAMSADKDLWISSLTNATDDASNSICSAALWNVNSATSSPRVMLGGASGLGQAELGDAALHFLESFPVLRNESSIK